MNNQTPGENTSQNNGSQRRKIEGTPFHLIKQWIDHDPLLDDTRYNYFLVMGNYRITEPTETEEETLNKLITDQWLIITNIIAIAVEKLTKQEPYELESL